jgi:hypothetical protein
VNQANKENKNGAKEAQIHGRQSCMFMCQRTGKHTSEIIKTVSARSHGS